MGWAVGKVCEALRRRFASSSEEARTNQAESDEEAEWRETGKDLINKKGGKGGCENEL